MCRLCSAQEPDCDSKHGLCHNCLARNIAIHPCKYCPGNRMHGVVALPDGSMVFAEKWFGVAGEEDFMDYGTIRVSCTHSYRKHLHCNPSDPE